MSGKKYIGSRHASYKLQNIKTTIGQTNGRTNEWQGEWKKNEKKMNWVNKWIRKFWIISKHHNLQCKCFEIPRFYFFIFCYCFFVVLQCLSWPPSWIEYVRSNILITRKVDTSEDGNFTLFVQFFSSYYYYRIITHTDAVSPLSIVISKKLKWQALNPY